MSEGQLLRPISTVNPWQKVRMRDKATNTYIPGYVVVGHDIGIRSKSGLLELEAAGQFEFYKLPGCTVVANQGQHRGATGWRFYQVPCGAMVLLDI